MTKPKWLIIDSFAGGGGASTGIERALGVKVDFAINHDSEAIMMHTANHPDTVHFQEDVWAIDPRHVVGKNKVGLLWGSPDCTHFSRAAGGRPMDNKTRGLVWVLVKWAATVKPRLIFIENVGEFVSYGPLDKSGKPIKEKEGQYFRALLSTFRRLGYSNLDYRELVAADYGVPTSRKRFFLIARRDGFPVVWPKQTHGDPKSFDVISGRLKPWVPAHTIIDWSIPAPSIFERSIPLVPNSLTRLAKGVDKFIIRNPEPFFAPPGAVVGSGQNHAEKVCFLLRQHGMSIGSDLNHPMKTVMATGQGKTALVVSHLMCLRGTSSSHLQSSSLSMHDPVPTITSSGTHIAEVRAFLMQYNGEAIGRSLSDPLGTITGTDRFGLFMVKGCPHQIVDIGMRMLQPHELYAAQGFPDDYIIGPDINGKRFTKKAQVRLVGNSVPPPLAEALVHSNTNIIQLHDAFSEREFLRNLKMEA